MHSCMHACTLLLLLLLLLLLPLFRVNMSPSHLAGLAMIPPPGTGAGRDQGLEAEPEDGYDEDPLGHLQAFSQSGTRHD